MAPSLTSRFFYLFKLWCCFLIFICLPQDLIFRLDSFLLSLTIMDVIVDVAAMALLMTAIATFIALIGTLFSLLLSLVVDKLGKVRYFSTRSGKVSPPDVGIFTHYLLLFMTCCLFAGLFRKWCLKLNYEIIINPLYIGLLLSILIYWRNQSNFHARVRHLVGMMTVRLLPTVCVIAVILTGWRMGAVTFRRHLESVELARQPMATSTKGKPNIILITFDALTAEDMSLYGYHLKTTPTIDAFAKECDVFDNAIAAANWTKPSLASLLTGKYPDRHRLINTGLTNNVDLYPKEHLPAILKTIGYQTVALNANWEYHPIADGTSAFFDISKIDFIAWENIPFIEYLHPFLGVNGSIISGKLGIRSILWLSEWVNEFIGSFPRLLLLKQYTRPFYPPELVFDSAKNILKDVNTFKGKPVFLWTHLFVPHAPYLPSQQWKGRLSNDKNEFSSYASQRMYFSDYYSADEQPYIDRLRLSYDENILYADNALESFIRTLKQSGRLDDSIVIISADHGESFSHGFQGHAGPLLYQSLVHIPLLIHLPGQKNQHRRTSTVSQVDVAPTILDLLGYAVPNWMDGRSLKEVMEGKQLSDKPVFTMNLDGIPIRGKIYKGNIAVIYGDYKYIYYGQLYSLKNDPEENTNLAEQEPVKAQMMNQLIVEMISQQGNTTGHGL